MSTLSARQLAAVSLLVGLVACGGGGSSTAPTPTNSTYSLYGGITDVTSGRVVSGATVTVLDGPNANRSVTADSVGFYSFDGLRSGSFTIRARALYYNDATKGVALTSSQSVDIAMPHQTINIEYRLTGTSKDVFVGYTNATGGSEQLDSVRPPWSYKFTESKAGVFLFLDAIINDSGSVTSEIYINGTLLQTASATGNFGSASVSGETP